ncbi:hypothetical protein CFE70_000565 [Pyrenophora teres f. teres 0-1]
MALRVGQILKGARGVYELLYPLKGSTVFKAKVVSSTSLQADCAYRVERQRFGRAMHVGTPQTFGQLELQSHRSMVHCEDDSSYGGPIGQPVDNETYQDEFGLAEQLAIMDHPGEDTKLITRDHWRKELENVTDPPVPRDLLDFIESILVIDPEKRPTAAEALMHPYLQTEA